MAHSPLTREQVLYYRLKRHHLTTRAADTSLETVIRDLGGVQAQILPVAKQALWARMQDCSSEDIDDALWRRRSIVKTWSMRGTLHLLAAEEFPIFVNALRRSGLREVQRWLGRYGIGVGELATTTETIVNALANGPLTRRALSEQVIAELGAKARQWIEHSWGGVVKHAALQGLVCYGPHHGREITFVRTDQWLSGSKSTMSEAESKRYVVRKYLHVYGPARIKDFAGWTGMQMKEARPIFEELQPEIMSVDVAGESLHALQRDVDAIYAEPNGKQAILLLPGFDPYTLAYSDKSYLVDSEHSQKVYRKAGWVSPVVLKSGRVVGVWNYEQRGTEVTITIDRFAALSADDQDHMLRIAADFGRFLCQRCKTTIVTRPVDQQEVVT